MKFLSFYYDNTEGLGLLSSDGGRVYPLSALGIDTADMADFIARYSKELGESISLSMAGADSLPLEKVRLLAPIQYPKHDCLCVGLNYLDHAMEISRFKGEPYAKLPLPTFFSKRVDRARGHDEEIPSHSDLTNQLDYESELAVVIGKRCDHVSPEDVYEHIFGYTIVNDVSARELQNSYGGQYTFGKSLDGFTPMGPWIVTRDEFASPLHLNVQSYVNGELRQNGNTRDFLFDIPYLVSTLSRGIVLEPGDILATGTPAGVGMGFSPPRFLKPGDIVECAVEGIGVLRNRVSKIPIA